MTRKKPIDIDWSKVAELSMPVIGPFVQGAMWYGFVNIDSRAQALGRLIAIAEIVPAVDLNLPKGVVLASLYDSTEDTLKIARDLVDAIVEIPDTVKEKIDQITDDLPSKEDILPEGINEAKAVGDFQDCRNGYKRDTPSYLQNRVTEGIYISGCMVRKGYTQKYAGELIKRFLD